MKIIRLLLLLLGVGMVANAIAAPPQELLTVKVQGDGMVTSDPAGITCPSDCDEIYKKGTAVTLTATDPNGGFLGWSGDCGGTQLTCAVKMTAPITVTAMFDTATVVYPAPVPQTGITRCWDTDPTSVIGEIDCIGTGQDGEYQAGVPWPSQRFTPNGDGTVTDNLTGLIWLLDANCFGGLNHQDALAAANSLAAPNCGLSDGSAVGDWRLPNVREILSLIDFSEVLPALPLNHPFLNVQGDPGGTGEETRYSTSSPAPGSSSSIFIVRIADGNLDRTGAAALFFVWPVKGGL